MRCLEKDRTRRYDTAAGLAADVERYLADEPVLACPPGGSRRWQTVSSRPVRLAAGRQETGRGGGR